MLIHGRAFLNVWHKTCMNCFVRTGVAKQDHPHIMFMWLAELERMSDRNIPTNSAGRESERAAGEDYAKAPGPPSKPLPLQRIRSEGRIPRSGKTGHPHVDERVPAVSVSWLSRR